MPEQEWYKEWFNSPFYHKLYFEKNGQDKDDFINRLLDHLHPVPGIALLDIACGRGDKARFLSRKGFQVTGIDISTINIAFAKQYENENLEFYQHDIRLPFRVNYYDLALNLFNNFGYFKTRREHDDAIRTIAGSLKSKGSFVVDYLNTHYMEEHLVPHEEKNILDTIYEINRWQSSTHFYKRIVVRDASLLHPVEYSESIAKFSLGDFNDMLSYHGLQVQEIFGDYQLGNYHVRNKPRLIIFAGKN